jgi:hypothetical protein
MFVVTELAFFELTYCNHTISLIQDLNIKKTLALIV